MNKEDLNNLGYLMNLSEADFDQWMNAASGKDIDYALELIKLAKVQHLMQEFELLDSIETNTDEANILITRIKSKI